MESEATGSQRARIIKQNYLKGPVLFRADGGRVAKIGLGHLSRCLVLADFLNSRGRKVYFLMRPLPGGADFVQKKGLETCFLPQEASRQEELEIIRKFCCENRISTVVFDLVDGAELLAQLDKPAGTRIVATDEFDGEFPSVDVLVDPRLWAEKVRVCNPPAIYLLGPGYQVLSKAWLRLKKAKREYPSQVKTVTISMGGADPMNLTGLVVLQIKKITRFEKVNVVYGPASCAPEGNPFGPKFRIHHGPDDFPDLIASSDLVITSGGKTPYEVASLGIPMIIVPTIEHERLTARAFVERGLALSSDLEAGESINPALEAVMDIKLRRQMGEKCRLLKVGEKVKELLNFL